MNGAGLLALTPLALVAATAVTLMLLAGFYRQHGVVFWCYQLGLLAALLAVPATAPETALRVTPLLQIDALFGFFAPLFILTAMVVGVMARQYFRSRPGTEECYMLLATATLGALVLAGAEHFAALFMGVELIGVASFILAAYPSGLSRRMDPLQRRSLEAGLKYLLLSSAASAFLLFGIALLYLHSGTLAFVDPLPAQNGAGPAPEGFAMVGLGLLLTGVAFKLSVVPFHLWTADVYTGAPTPVTALIATLSKGALIVALLRYLMAGEILRPENVATALIILASLSMLVGNLLALRQDNIKRLLAYSSIAHMGYLLVAFIAVGTRDTLLPSLAFQASAIYLVAYFITTLGAFSVVGAVSDGAGELSRYRVEHYRGLFWRAPWLAGCFILILLSLAGIPLTIGFIGKFYIFAAGADTRLWFLLAMVITGSALGLYYYLRVILVMIQEPLAAAPGDLTPKQRWLSYGLTLLLVLFGVYPAPILGWLPV